MVPAKVLAQEPRQRPSQVKRMLAGPCGLKEEKDSEINYTSHS